VRFLFIATIFLGSALLFLAQPMAAKMILPRFGGSPAVWTTSVLFFQVLLLVGYWLAHRLGKFGFSRVSAAFVASQLGVAFGISRHRLPEFAIESEVLGVIATLAAVIGLPFLVLSTCSPIIQGLFAATSDARRANPYFLYAASNLGSLLALLAYPSLVEPHFSLGTQFAFFKAGLLALAVLVLACSIYVPTSTKIGETNDRQPVSREMRLRWLLLAAVPSSLMLGLTSFATTNVAPVPLFWVVPLAVYLLTFVIAFSEGNKIPSTLWARILPMLAVPLALLMILESSEPIVAILLIHGLAFIVAALMCHTRLAETKPPAANLTEFYLWLAIGGAVGGLFNAIIAPTVFSTIVEYPIAIVAACLLRPATDQPNVPKDLLYAFGVLVLTATIAIIARFMDIAPSPMRTLIVIGVPVVLCFLFSRHVVRFALALGAVFLATHLLQVGSDSKVLYAARSFFGVHRVLESERGRFHLLAHGTTLHGIQDAENPTRPLTYYTTRSPIGEVFGVYDFDTVGLVGLGVGSCAAYGVPGQKMTFFEIDPLVIEIAQNDNYFTFLRDSKADIDIVKGDARLTLAHRRDGEFGLLVLDAFSSDAIPMHLLTREAMQLYLAKIKGDGIIAVHISNRMLDLEPIIARVAQDLGVVPLALEVWPNESQQAEGMRPTIWIVIVRERAHAAKLIGWRPAEPRHDTPLWTDDYSNILSAWAEDQQ
jgi:hypothetical protein